MDSEEMNLYVTNAIKFWLFLLTSEMTSKSSSNYEGQSKLALIYSLF